MVPCTLTEAVGSEPATAFPVLRPRARRFDGLASSVKSIVSEAGALRFAVLSIAWLVLTLRYARLL
jgi:hypothetical protein